ncbi:MAG: DUF1499 domain-containing protein [Pseudomonadota bacterium]
MKVLWFSLLFFTATFAAIVLAGQFGLLRGRAPNDLGVRNSRLKPPSRSPNSVSSQADLYPDNPQREYAYIAPFQFSGDAEQAMARLAEILTSRERTVVASQAPDYIYAQSTTKLLRFTDDIEFWLDRSAGLIHARSASRLGRKDFHVNRARIETIRAQFAKN